MARCSKCRFGNLVNIGTWEDPQWMMECNAYDVNEPDYISLTEAENENLPCDWYVPCMDDHSKA